MKQMMGIYFELSTGKYVTVEEELVLMAPNSKPTIAYVYEKSNNTEDRRLVMTYEDFIATHEKIDFIVYYHRLTKQLVAITKTSLDNITYLALNETPDKAVETDNSSFFRMCSFFYNPIITN